MSAEERVSFGDTVRIRGTPDTEELDLAGLEGHVYGFTTPSVTGVEVIGSPAEDYAVNVFFDDLEESFWFAEDLVEFIDYDPGAEIRIEGVSKSWVREADGSWSERDDPSKRWWEFWK